MNASVPTSVGLKGFQQHHHLAGMTSADTSAVPYDPPVADRRRLSLRRLLAPFAIAIALLSAFLTFIVLTVMLLLLTNIGDALRNALDVRRKA